MNYSKYPMGRGIDIGIFDHDHQETPGREILLKNQFKVTEEDVKTIISTLGGNQHAEFTIIDKVQKGLDDRKLRMICDFAD